MKKIFLEKGGTYLVIALLAGIFLLLFSGGFSNEKNTRETGEEYAFELCEKRYEDRLHMLLTEISGIGDVSVMITLDKVPSAKERPCVRGAAVVCKGTESAEIRLKVVMVCCAALGVSSDKIFVTFT